MQILQFLACFHCFIGNGVHTHYLNMQKRYQVLFHFAFATQCVFLRKHVLGIKQKISFCVIPHFHPQDVDMEWHLGGDEQVVLAIA